MKRGNSETQSGLSGDLLGGGGDILGAGLLPEENPEQPLNPQVRYGRYGASQNQPPEEKGSSIFSCFSMFSCCCPSWSGNNDGSGKYANIKEISEPNRNYGPAPGNF